MRRRFGHYVLGVVLFSAACSSGPKYRVDDALLADVPVSDKQGMLSAKSEIDQATEERRKAESDLQVIQRDLSVAQSEYGQAKLEVDKAEADLKLAQQTRDMNRVQQAQQQLKRAKLAREIADAKVDWQKQRRRAQRAAVEAADRHREAAAARFEQEKARLAQARGKRPTNDFNVLNFDQQATTLQARYDQARIDANKELLSASQREQKVHQLEAQYQQSYGAPPGAAPPTQPADAYAPGQPGAPQGTPPPGSP